MGTAAKWAAVEALDRKLIANTERLKARLFAAGGVGTREMFVSNAGIELIVNHVSYGKVDVEDVLAGRCAAEEFTATQDGRHYDRRGWCECGGAEDAVYVERWTREGVDFHGWVCGGCRRLVQAG